MNGGSVWGNWFPAASDMQQGPGFGQGIGVEFSKPPELDSLRRAFGFTPVLPGRVEMLSPCSAVFIPSKEPEPETEYTMIISGSLRDSNGLKMGSDFSMIFKSDIPRLNILSFSPGDDETYLSPDSGSFFRVSVDENNRLQCTIYFSLPFNKDNPAVWEESVFRIQLRPFFPGSLPPVSLRTAMWNSADRLLLQWEGLERGSGDEPHYYRLLIPGGPNGVHNGKGSYLKNDYVFYLEAGE